MSTPILEFVSHTGGRNAKVRVFPTHLELDSPKQRSKAAAVASLGWSLMGPRKREVDTIPIGAITSVTTSGRIGNSDVTIVTPGLVISARVSKGEAEKIKSTLLQLMNGAPAQAPAPQPAAQGGDAADQLQKLAALRDQGILSPQEFEAKKADILNRM